MLKDNWISYLIGIAWIFINVVISLILIPNYYNGYFAEMMGQAQAQGMTLFIMSPTIFNVLLMVLNMLLILAFVTMSTNNTNTIKDSLNPEKLEFYSLTSEEIDNYKKSLNNKIDIHNIIAITIPLLSVIINIVGLILAMKDYPTSVEYWYNYYTEYYTLMGYDISNWWGNMK